MTALASAWAWVLHHRADVERITARVARGFRGLDPDDLRSAVVLRLVEKHDRFDPARGSPASWIYWTAREVATSTRRGAIPSADLDVETMCESIPIDARIDARRTLARVQREANAGQIAAVESVAEGWSGDEVRDRLGCSLATRNARVYRLRDRLRRLG